MGRACSALPNTVTAMTESFVLRATGGPRWTIHPLADPDGGGDIYFAATELDDDTMRASTNAAVHARFSSEGSLPEFATSLAADWRGWEGARGWRSLYDELELDARHDGRGHVRLGVFPHR